MPVLQSLRSNKLILNDLKEMFSKNYEEMQNCRYTEDRLSKEVIRGVKYDYSVNSSRNVSPNQIKQVINRKIRADARSLKHEDRLPVLVSRKQRQWSETIKVIKLDRGFQGDENEKGQILRRPRRSKTEEREPVEVKVKVSSRKRVKKSVR